LTDVTGFGLSTMGSELARGAALKMQIQLDQVPLLPGVLGHRRQRRMVASSRNWEHSAEFHRPISAWPQNPCRRPGNQRRQPAGETCARAKADAVLALSTSATALKARAG
jgi:selenide,water dikinase